MRYIGNACACAHILQSGQLQQSYLLFGARTHAAQFGVCRFVCSKSTIGQIMLAGAVLSTRPVLYAHWKNFNIWNCGNNEKLHSHRNYCDWIATRIFVQEFWALLLLLNFFSAFFLSFFFLFLVFFFCLFLLLLVWTKLLACSIMRNVKCVPPGKWQRNEVKIMRHNEGAPLTVLVEALSNVCCDECT